MELDELRNNIDRVDREILKLINERYQYVIEVGKWKKNRDHAFYVPEREKSLLENLEKVNLGPLKNESLRAIYREIMSGALALENPLKIAYLGPPATFSHIAAIAKFGHSVEYVPRSSIADVFMDVESGRFNYGCVPIENSTEGAVNHTLDMFTDSSAKICSEMNMRIHHNFMSNTEFNKIKRVYSHAQILGQCRRWIQEHIPSAELVEMSSSTKSAELAAREEGSAAIASSLAAEIYKLKIIYENIEDTPDNTTRFLVISRQETKPTGDDKTSICFVIKDRVGVLYDCLLPFKNENITLTMIESRPSKRRNWEYIFFLDFLGHASDEKIRQAIASLDGQVQSLRVLGSYPRCSATV